MDYPCFIIHNDFVTKLSVNHAFPFCISKDVSVNLKKKTSDTLMSTYLCKILFANLYAEENRFCLDLYF